MASSSYISFVDDPATIFAEGSAGARRTLAIDVSSALPRGSVVCGRVRADGKVSIYRSDRDMLRGAKPLFDDFIVSQDDTDEGARERIVAALDESREQPWHEVARRARVVSSLGDRPPPSLVAGDPRIGIDPVTRGLWLRVPLLRTADEVAEALDGMPSFAPGLDESRLVAVDDEDPRLLRAGGRVFRNCMPHVGPADEDIRAMWHGVDVGKEDFEMPAPRFADRAADPERYPPGWWRSIGFEGFGRDNRREDRR